MTGWPGFRAGQNANVNLRATRLAWRAGPAAGTGWHRNGNLPAEMTSFVGRRAELAELCRLLEISRLVTITGAGGIGKTRLAIRAAGELGDRFRDGAWVAELSAVTSPGVLPYTVAEVLGIRDHTSRSGAEVLAEYLADKNLLLILDTCEHLTDACAGLAEKLLEAAPRLRIIATSRQRLGVSGEHVLLIRPLTLPVLDAESDLAALRRSEAVVLFAERGSAVAPGFSVNDRNGAAVAMLCRRLDGVPLALELAAARLRVLSVDQLLERLDDRIRLLGAGRRGGAPRHQTMRAAIGWSYALCTHAERLAWARLSVFPGDFPLAAAERVCAGPGILAGAEFDVIAGLVDKSIVLAHQRGNEVRYRLLDDIRAYGTQRLGNLGETPLLRRRHRDWCLELACSGEREWFGGGQAEIYRRTEGEHANLQAALEFSLTTPAERLRGLELVAALWFYWAGCGRLGEGRNWLERALRDATPETPEWAKALWVAGYISVLQGDLGFAVPMLERCKDYATKAADEPALAYSIQCLGCAAVMVGDHVRASALLAEALDRFKSLGELNSNVIMARVALAMAFAFRGDQVTAERICRQTRDVCEASGEQWACAYVRYVLAYAAWTRHNLAEGAEHTKACLRIHHAFHDLVGIVLAVELMALLAASRGDPRRGATLLGVAANIWPRVGTPLFGSEHFNTPHDQSVRLTRQALSDVEFSAAFDYGAGLSLDDAVAWALGAQLVGARFGALEPQIPRGAAPAGRMRQRSLWPPLTRRECQVAALVADGLSNREIGERLVIAKRTADAHVENILARLGFTSRAQVAAWVERHRAGGGNGVQT